MTTIVAGPSRLKADTRPLIEREEAFYMTLLQYMSVHSDGDYTSYNNGCKVTPIRSADTMYALRLALEEASAAARSDTSAGTVNDTRRHARLWTNDDLLFIQYTRDNSYTGHELTTRSWQDIVIPYQAYRASTSSQNAIASTNSQESMSSVVSAQDLKSSTPLVSRVPTPYPARRISTPYTVSRVPTPVPWVHSDPRTTPRHRPPSYQKSEVPAPEYVEYEDQYTAPHEALATREEIPHVQRHISLPPLIPPRSRYSIQTRMKTCVACQEPIQGTAVKLPCNHLYDRDCISALIVASTHDESLFPPSCCSRNIPFDLLRPFMAADAYVALLSRAQEVSTLNRVYCSNSTCSHFLGPQENSEPPHFLRCPVDSCGSTTCAQCKTGVSSTNPWTHTCRDDIQDQKVLKLAKRAGWARCPGCSQLIQRIHGCNHMTCKCRTQFCYVCQARWNDCRCHGLGIDLTPVNDRIRAGFLARGFRSRRWRRILRGLGWR